MNRIALLLTPLALAACSGAPSTGSNATVENGAAENAAEPVAEPAPAANELSPAPAATAKLEADYLGRWRGVEGTYLEVAKRDGGGVAMEMQYDLDHKGTIDGSVTAEGLRFMRDGKPELARPTDGDATGLKWLAGKKDCLTVKPGEGYCRD